MLRVELDQLQAGMKLALPVRCRHSYKILLNAGTVINEEHVQRLKELNPADVYIFSPHFMDDPAQELYREAVSSMDDIFQEVISGNKVDVSRVKQVVNGIVEQLKINDQILVQLARLNDADSYSVSHCVNVCIYSLFIGSNLNLRNEQMQLLGLGALLHDIGKLYMPESLLRKGGKLSDREFSIIKDHPLIGYRSLEGTDTPEEVGDIVRDHHEKCDGSGYPYGIGGEKISFLTKIVSVADIYDAVTSDRAYRPRMLPHEGMEILLANCSAGKIDPQVVKLFTRKVVTYPPGCTVRLNTGEIAKVVESKALSWRPKVVVKKGNRVKFVDLAANPTVFISQIIDIE
ncbi:MAG TPA: HD-GYP domain-containing protein [Clostridia bacterium]|jgi:putative nucleotidyltransferase with HDIG domain|nr:HD-GYP domain-containing protein [Clostridia bacterium]